MEKKKQKKVMSICSKFLSLVNLELAKQVSLNVMFISSSQNIIVLQYPLHLCVRRNTEFLLRAFFFDIYVLFLLFLIFVYFMCEFHYEYISK